MIRLSWLISLGISLLGFLIIGHFFTIQPDETANNGSLGFIGIIFVLPFLLLSIFITFRYILALTRSTTDRLMKSFSIIGGILLVGVLLYFSLDYKNGVLAALDGSAVGPTLPKLNEYTYTIYFNFYTFALIHAIVGVIAAVVGVVKPGTKKEELPE
ncbi:nucleoside-diphosphate sugar epimerase [Ureibacillus aquaedulcis]|uniref:Nucleoside-diphosphate sugar epimerase n=1 Tax=Ureibacillus aquaedulcis TaxID=3058421 RepID=A0ABT8GQC6_9BACL|nr:nucleoside-diphosphate sugar epimerase [Ureibacillus sp. BA0131]MDN4493625.1 nucleoside-diphosphate sugar epimerase [Ureibacillus sp. BA0131]